MSGDFSKIVVFMTHGPRAPERCATPIYMANLGAVMDSEAAVIFQMEGVLLMKHGVAEELRAVEGGKLVIDFIREAKESGVEFYCCSAAMDAQGMTADDLIPECDGTVGGAWMLEQAGEADIVLTY